MTGKTGVSLETLAEKAPQAADFMRQFSNANRLMLLCQIAQQECSVSDIQDALGIKQPALSRAIQALEEDLRIPVLTANQVLLWHLLRLAGTRVPVTRYGRLFDRDVLPGARQ